MGRQTASVAAAGLVFLCALPVLWFLMHASGNGAASAWQEVISVAGAASMLRTLKLIATAGGIGTVFGWLVGTPLSLRHGAGKAFAMVLLTMVLICPPFLWAVGVQGWKGFVPFLFQTWFDGFSGHVIASSIVVGALVALACAGSFPWLTRSTVESSLIAGGPWQLHWLLLCQSFPLAAGAGLLGALVVVGEAGTGQMMGWQGVAGVIHSAFITEHDFQKAASRTLALVLCLTPLMLLSAWLVARFAVRTLAVDSLAKRARSAGTACQVIAACAPLIIGMTGLVRPLTNGGVGPAFRDALLTLKESAGATLQLVTLSALIVVCISLGLGNLMSRRVWLWRVVLGVGLVQIALPQSIHGLGWLMLRSRLSFMPAHPGGWEPALVLATRWSLAASHFAALAWQSVPTSALDAARLGGISGWRWMQLIMHPVVFNRVLPVSLLVALICLGDATAVVLLQAPGWSTYATRLFSIMDNAPEKQVAALCLVYLLLPLAVGVLWVAAKSTFHSLVKRLA